MPVWVGAIVMGALALAGCGGDSEDAGSAATRRESTTTTTPESTTATPPPGVSPSPQEAAMLAEAAGLFTDQPDRDQEVLESSRAMCGGLDEAASVGSSFLPTVVLGSMFRDMGEEAATVLARLAAEHLCPQHTATVEAFIASYDPSGPLPGALPGPAP